ncbi:MAG: RDD family protein [Alcanivoracaceae bacterium]|nr:RDD family protein [Alcanivoracaceae bacterium]
MIDDRQSMRTAEGATLSLVPAGILPRGGAFLIDLLIRAPVYIAALIVMSTRTGSAAGLMLIFLFLLEWFYPVLFEVLRHGQTPGKRMLGIAVTHTDGAPVTLNGSLLRNLIRQADFFPMFYLTGFVAMLSNRRFQRFGDMAANTMVVHVGNSRPPQQISVAQTTPPDWQVTLDDQQTLLALLERQDSLSAARRQELCALGWPELDSAQAEQRALATARYLRGLE